MKYIKLFEQFRLLLEADGKKINGILYSLSNKGGKTIVLLPGSGKDGGQGDADFQKLADDLGKDFSVFTADFPNEFNVRDYAQKIAKEIETNPNIKTCAVGGFSIGGAIAWHLAMALKGSKKFNNQLFFIDSGIPTSTEEFAENIVKGNTPRLAFAIPVGLIKKARLGENITKEEEKSIRSIYTETELADFKKTNEGNYIEYMGKDFPPANDKLDLVAKAINEEYSDKVYIIEDKYDTTKFDVRYSVMPKEVESMTFKEGDVINLRAFVEKDTLAKKGLGRETTPGKITKDVLPALDGVEVISLIAGNKEGKARPEEDIEAVKKEATGSTTGDSKVIVITGTEHGNITKSLGLATNISYYFK
jgi:pimeloyl-ACP methyl ester carboxylesterase